MVVVVVMAARAFTVGVCRRRYCCCYCCLELGFYLRGVAGPKGLDWSLPQDELFVLFKVQGLFEAERVNTRLDMLTPTTTVRFVEAENLLVVQRHDQTLIRHTLGLSSNSEEF